MSEKNQTACLQQCLDEFWKSAGGATGQNPANTGQHPTYFEFPHQLTSQPWWQLDSITEPLTAAHEIMEEECRQLQQHGADKADTVRTNCLQGEWTAHFFMESGKWNESVCNLCPYTTSVLKSLPCCVSSFGHVYLSIITSGTLITPHYGCTNTKLRVQFPLYGCSENCVIMVNGESTTYTDGKALIFDDSYLHEVRNGNEVGAPPRVVLVIDVWHPDLTAASIDLLQKEFHPNRELNFPTLADATTVHPAKVKYGKGPASPSLPAPGPPDCTYIMKILSIGDIGVGKTSFARCFTGSCFEEQMIGTIGVDFYQRLFTVDNVPVKVRLWDIAGPERFRSISGSYYRGSEGIFLMFCLNNRLSFEDVLMWHGEVQKYGKIDVDLVLVGCKSDLVDTVPDDPASYVSTAEAQALAAKLNIPYIECSAKTGQNLDAAVTLLTSMVLKRFSTNPPRCVAPPRKPDNFPTCAIM